ncbi:MAG: hypothetical protein IH991_11875, partial [Planctomycetes bacterium]|nr:hypothetical protein [Planctomycetota bacterium]
MYPVHDVLGKLLDRCIELEASDLHLTSGIEPYFRVNDQFATFGEEPIAPNIVEEIALSLMSTHQQEFFQDKRSIDLAFFSETKTRYRVHAFYQRGSVAIAIRRLDNEFRSYGELNLPDEVGQLAEFLHGLVLVT